MADLSPRQREVLDLVAAGRTSKEIALILGISESTVNWHLSKAFARLGASSRAEAVALAMRGDVDKDVPRPSPVHPTLPLSSMGLAFALTLLLGLLGGALLAESNLTLPTPSLAPGVPTVP
jgi:DNA-binding CsgD family transcriptional regulator